MCFSSLWTCAQLDLAIRIKGSKHNVVVRDPVPCIQEVNIHAVAASMFSSMVLRIYALKPSKTLAPSITAMAIIQAGDTLASR